jgi:hypothetical protein
VACASVKSGDLSLPPATIAPCPTR